MEILIVIIIAVAIIVVESIGEKSAEAWWEFQFLWKNIEWEKLPDNFYPGDYPTTIVEES